MRTPLQKGEKVLLVTYSSWTTLVAPALVALAMLALGIFIVWRYKWMYAWIRSSRGRDPAGRRRTGKTV